MRAGRRPGFNAEALWDAIDWNGRQSAPAACGSRLRSTAFGGAPLQGAALTRDAVPARESGVPSQGAILLAA